METLIQVGLPTLMLLITTIILVRGFLKNQREAMNAFLLKEAEYRKVEGERRTIELSKANKEITMPLRLHAYERISLFVTRLDIVNMLMRSNYQGLSAKQFKTRLLMGIEEEFSHNVTQQMYMSAELWQIILLSKQEACNILNNVFKQLDAAAEGKDLSAQKFVDVIAAYLEDSPQQGQHQAQAAIKKEVSLLF